MIKFENSINHENKERESFGHKEYDIENNVVDLKWRTFYPSNPGSADKFAGGKATIFTPCWSVTEESEVIKELCGELANYSQSSTYAVDTRAERIVANATEIQAEAIERFIQESNFKELTLVGNSIGGIEAINLAAILRQHHPEVKVNGLILLDSLSLYDQKTSELLKNSIKDSLSNRIIPSPVPGPVMMSKQIIDQEMTYGRQFKAEIIKEMKASNIYYPQRLLNQLREMADKNPFIEKIDVPVVLVQGSKDLLSDPKKIIPAQREQDTVQGYIEDFKEREKFLQENIFKNSPYVRMVVPERAGHHNLAYCRPQSVARSSLYLLERWHRDNKKDEGI